MIIYIKGLIKLAAKKYPSLGRRVVLPGILDLQGVLEMVPIAGLGLKT
jgi:hypothetical protein